MLVWVHVCITESGHVHLALSGSVGVIDKLLIPRVWGKRALIILFTLITLISRKAFVWEAWGRYGHYPFTLPRVFARLHPQTLDIMVWDMVRTHAPSLRERAASYLARGHKVWHNRYGVV